MAEAVVDGLEVVEIEEEHGNPETRRAAATEHRVPRTVGEERAVREAGERIVERLVAKLVLGLAPVGDVEEVALPGDLVAVGVPGHHRPVPEPDRAPVLRDQPVLDRQRRAQSMRLGMREQHPVAVVRMERLDEERRIRRPLVHRVPEQRLHLGARVEVRALVIECVDVRDQRQMLDERAVPPLGLEQIVLGARVLDRDSREVGGDADELALVRGGLVGARW